MNDITSLVHRLTTRTRRRLLLRAVLGSLMGLACAGLVALRLQQAGVESGRISLLSAGIIAVIVAWQWWSVRRNRQRRLTLVYDLDRSLGLDARLLTAVEFADAPTPPVLYSRLLEETAKALPQAQRRLPPVLDRPGAALALVALVLLLWPHANTLHLAMTPPPPVAPETPPVTPPEPPPQPQQDQQPNQQQTQQQSGQDQQKQHQGGGQQPQPQGSGSKDPQASQGNQQADQSQQPKEQPGDSGKQSQQQADQSQQQQGGKDGKSGAEQASGQPKDAAKKGQQGGEDGKAASAKLAAKGEKGDAGKAGVNSGSPSDAAQQQALKADIQQLLKELSSELKEMQAEMEAKQSNSKEPSPLAGGTTDPQLYEQSAKLDKASGTRLPVQLEVDTKPTTAPRRGSGTGQASKQASEALPQQQPEDATLSDVRTAEQGQARHAIPPEYQPVFERLSPNQPQEPSTERP